MKKLLRLTDFETGRLNESHLSSIFGGRSTGAGAFCSAASGSESGCMGYTSDTDPEDGGAWTYHGKYDVTKTSC